MPIGTTTGPSASSMAASSRRAHRAPWPWRVRFDAVCAHPNVGPFIARQLIQRLVCSNPSPDYVRRVARVFNAAGPGGERGNLAQVVRAVLSDPEARPTLDHAAPVAPASWRTASCASPC